MVTGPWPVLLGVGGLFAVVGLLVLRKAFGTLGTAFRLWRVDRVETAALEPGGPLAVDGTIRPATDEFVDSIWGPDGVVVSTRVARKSPGSNHGESRWDGFHWNYETRPFRIEDDSGEALVLPPTGEDDDTGSVPDPDIDLPTRSRAVGTDGVPPEVAAYDESVGGLRHPPGEATLKIEQGVAAPGDDVYVVGEAVRETTERGEEVVVSGRGDPGGFTISTSSGGSPGRHAAEGLVLSVFGLVATVVGGAMLALLVVQTVGL